MRDLFERMRGYIPFVIKRKEPERVEGEKEEGAPAIPQELPILPLKETVVYPLTVLPILVGKPRSVKLIDEAVLGDRIVGLVALKEKDIEDPEPGDVYTTGTAAIIHRLLKAPDGTAQLLVQGLERIRIREFTQLRPYFKAQVELAPDTEEKSIEVEALARNTVELFQRLVSLVPHLPERLMMTAIDVDEPRHLVYLVATAIRMETADAQEILEIDEVKGKLRKLTTVLTKELEVLELGKKIQSEAQSEMGKMQREYLLREQLKAIKKELGEEDEQALEIKELAEKIEAAGMPEEPKKEAKRELDRLSKLPTAAAEYSVIRTYLDWLVDMPWQVSTEDNLDIERARQVLDEDHYDLEKIKERVLEYLAVRKLRLERGETPYPSKAGILCFLGPPGTGKTSIGQSIARALGRKFIRMSLGGMRDEAEIRGHRRTYIGAMPGRILQAIRRVGTKNPVFMLDEIDKVGVDWRGDPSSALLEVLDPEQNKDFRDHYLGVPFDLSQVMFITTGNLVEPISPPLQDRMEVLTFSGYIEEEKIRIAREYLIPRQVKENGLQEGEIEFEEGALRTIIRDYTREAGVRNLEREIANICRKVATKVAEGQEGPAILTTENVSDFLGKPKYFFEAAERTEIPGVATGLAWTMAGGDILFVEATKMPGKKGFTLTGQLGDVMKESAQAALSYVRSKAEELGIPEDFFEKNDIHLHIPTGATPKDGPSAGVTMCTALASLLTRRPVRADVGMTGEITLRGQVLPVGGIKEKVLAARRAGLQTVILPKRNDKDLDEVPEELKGEMKFVLAETVDEVLEAALRDERVRKEKAGRG